ncbi:MAG TPA: acyltransferase, partial [Allosphingosinicella sp.]|nr:acyltransferase [Allosphingosinicella sp.]
MGRAAGAAVGEPGQHGAVGPDRRYRPDVDGLRALAVAPILLGHAGVPGFGGGFLGVDLFFVISGYLITSILARDLGEGRFSLIGFYRRRAVRILPALLTMLAAVLLAGHLLMFPAESKELGKSAGAAAGFIANLYFYSSIGYFSPAAELRPLLHTWSLGAEEQFYLLYPLLLAGAYRVFGRRLVPAVMVLTLASLAFSAAAAWRWPEDAFYLLPSRGWELGLGGLAALGVLPALGRAVQNGAALAGAALVAMGLVFASWGLAVPVPAALLPCAGCMLLLTYGEGAATSRLFAAHPARALGLI